MSRLIDADALINRIVFHTDWTTDEKEAFEDEINAEPTIEERKTGKWIPFDERYPWSQWYQCSECGAVRKNIAFMENFCPNCGARMVGEGEDNE